MITRPVRLSRALRGATIAMLVVVLGLGAMAARAAEMVWTATSYIVSFDAATGAFTRRGIAMFKNGEVASFETEGKITSSVGNVQTISVKIVYTFDDGSSLTQEGVGRVERQSASRNTQTGEGLLVSGTGRFEGISGKTTSTSRGLTPWDAIHYFHAEYTTAKK